MENKGEEDETWSFYWKKVGATRGTCSRKPQRLRYNLSSCFQ